MKTVLTSARRARVLLCSVALLVSGLVSARAYSPAHFNAVQSQLHGDIAALSALPSPTRDERLFLRTVQRGSNVLTKISTADGRTLRSLNSLLGRRESYSPTLETIRSNLLTGFNAEQAFVANLLPELPDSAEATAVKAQFQRFLPLGAKLNAATTLAMFSGLYDGAKRRLDDLLIRANQALLIPFPSSLTSPNSVSAVINGVTFRTSQGAATDNVFSAVATETNLNVTLGAVGNSGSGTRGILFSIPNAPFGTFRYPIPAASVFTNRTGIYPPETENNVGATNGAIFINATATEVYGVFSCSGPGFNITDGKFRITISSQP